MKKAVFIDRDGVINVERGDYTYLPDDFVLAEGVEEALGLLKSMDFLTIIVTNQAGIAKGLYSHEDVALCHQKMHRLLPSLIDDVFYAPWHPSFSESLSRKPGSLMFERALALYGIDPGQSWMVGDNERDLLPARRLGIRTIAIGPPELFTSADYFAGSLLEAAKRILAGGVNPTVNAV